MIYSSLVAQALATALISYLVGSLTFATWLSRLATGIDLRQAGSRHATATNAIRTAGWRVGVLVFLLDLGKGFLAVFLAARYGSSPWLAPLAGVMVVVGHCYPIFGHFRGGMGLAASGGGILALSPAGFVLGVGLLVILVISIRHAARAALISGLLVVPLFWLAGLRGPILPLAALDGLVIAIRFASDWRREYREVWLDRGKDSRNG